MESIIKVDDIGDFKIPKAMTERLGIQKDDALFVLSTNDAIIIKKIEKKPLDERFKDFSDHVEARFEDAGVTENDVSAAVEWTRR